MGINPVQGGQSAESIGQPQTSKAEQQKLFDLQWAIGLIGTYVAVSKKNGDISHQLDGLKKGMKSGESPDKLAQGVNQLIDQINQGIPSDKAPFPAFQFTSEGNEPQALSNYVISFEKYLNSAAENGKIDKGDEQTLFNKSRTVVDGIGAIPTEESVDKFNDLIGEANKALPLEFQLHGLGRA